jgi:hypothetical protein
MKANFVIARLALRRQARFERAGHGALVFPRWFRSEPLLITRFELLQGDRQDAHGFVGAVGAVGGGGFSAIFGGFSATEIRLGAFFRSRTTRSKLCL